MRGALMLLSILAIGLVWQWFRLRHAMRTVESWRGTGICHDLEPAEAGLLLGRHPGIIVAAALEPVLASGRARVTAGRPLGLDWGGGGPAGPFEAALGSALAEGGDRVHDVLELLYESVDHKVATFSGRATAVHFRKHILEVRNRALAAGRLEVEDRAWLLMDDPDVLWDRAPDGPEREIFRDLVRFASLLRTRLLADVEIQAAAYARHNMFWRYRPDLRRDRVALGPWMVWQNEGEDEACVATGPLGDAARGLARALGGTVSGFGAWPLPFTYLDRSGLQVEGRCEERPVTVEFRDDGTLLIVVRSRQDGRLVLVRASFAARLDPFPSIDFETGDREFDESFLLREIVGPGGRAWLDSERVRGRITALPDLERLRVDDERVRCDFTYDRSSIRTGPVLEKIRAVCALAEVLGLRSR